VRHERLVPLRLFEGQDDALADVASFDLAVGGGSLPHRHGLVRAQAEPAISQPGIVSSRAPGAWVLAMAAQLRAGSHPDNTSGRLL